jgi:hypothetical protein
MTIIPPLPISRDLIKVLTPFMPSLSELDNITTEFDP